MTRILFGAFAAAALLSTGNFSHAAPFLLGDQVCGSLTKGRANDGSIAWKVVGCPPLERLAQCGNGVLDELEACDRALPESCPGKKVCVACEACVRHVGSPIPTPTPPSTPQPPTPTPASSCAQGELPPFPGVAGFHGLDFVSIADGATHEYCLTLSEEAHLLQFAVSDSTGGAQCSWFTVTLTPPAGSGRQVQTSFGRDVSLQAFTPSAALPQGVWRLSIEASEGSGCAQRYRVTSTDP